jgi:hypothetical protein
MRRSFGYRDPATLVRRDRRLLIGGAVVFGVVIVLILIAGSGGSGSRTGGTTTSAGADSLVQTWGKNYSETTCAEWSSAMTPQQRYAAAADMLTGARNKGDGGQGLPPAPLIRTFMADVSEGCSATDDWSVAEVGASIYLIGRDLYRP